METISELNNIWNQTLQLLEDKVDDKRIFDVFLSGSTFRSLNDNKLTIAVNSNLAATILSTKYLSLIQDAVKDVTGQNYKINFVNAQDIVDEPVQEVEEPKYFKYSTVNPTLTFDNFITGTCNIEAKQASLLISKNPGNRDYNPLFIYSDSGLGKTHLLSAIFNSAKESAPKKKRYIVQQQIFLKNICLLQTVKRNLQN